MKNYTLILLLAITLIGCRGGVPKSPDPASNHFSGDVEYNESSSLNGRNIRFIYRQPINGYEVTIDWQPFELKSETGTVKINFSNTTTGKSFEYINREKYSNAAIYDIVFSDEFEGHFRDTTYYLDYDFQASQSLTPIHHEAPFQFLDIDFDGEDELLINNWDLLRGGNTYNVYEIEESQGEITLNLRKDEPLYHIQESSLINTRNKTITTELHGSSADHCTVVFSKQSHRQGVFNFPDSLMQTTGGIIVKDYNAQTSSEFHIDTIYLHRNGRDYIFTQPKR